MRKNLTVFLCIFFAHEYCDILYAQSVHVPLNHSVYGYVERWEAKGALRNELTGTKPFTRLTIADFLIKIRSADENLLLLTPVDLDLLKYYEEEFKDEIEILNPASEIDKPVAANWLENLRQTLLPDIFYRNGKNLLEIKREDFTLIGDILVYLDNSLSDIDSLSSTDKVHRYTTGVQLRGSLGKNIGYFIDARNTKEWGSRTYPIGRDITAPGLGWINNFGSYQYHDETTAYITAKASLLEFEIGKNHNQWGSGLLLSNNATSYDYIKIKTKIWKLTFSHLFANLVQFPRIIELDSNESPGGKKKYAKKYLTAHRLEINLGRGINVGVHESVVYGQRGVELAYLNPVMFLRSAEHYLGDQDNALMGLDLSLKVRNGLKLYFEFLMDDVFIKKLGTDWWGNKFGYDTYVYWADPIGLQNVSLRLEYTKIKPFVYTHRFAINEYKHYNTSLGSALPPNTEQIYFSMNYRQSRKLFYFVEAWYNRHGSSTVDHIVGGSIREPTPKEGDEYLGFLRGRIETRKGMKITLSYEYLRNLYILGTAEIKSGSNITIQSIPGKGYTSKRLFFSIGLNY